MSKLAVVPLEVSCRRCRPQVTLYHVLKLFPSSGAPAPVVMGPLKTLVCEYYDEMIFQEPSLMMQQLLTSTRQITLGPYKHETDCE